MNKILSILIVLLSLLSISAFAQYSQWSQEGNAGAQGTGSSGLGFYSTFYPDGHQIALNYSSCSITGGTDYETLLYDYNNDKIEEIAFVKGTTLYIYDVNCNYVDSYVTGSILAMPVLTNQDGDSYQEIVYIDSTHNITSIEYDAGTSTWNKLYTRNLDDQLGSASAVINGFAHKNTVVSSDLNSNHKFFVLFNTTSSFKLLLVNFTGDNYATPTLTLKTFTTPSAGSGDPVAYNGHSSPADFTITKTTTNKLMMHLTPFYISSGTKQYAINIDSFLNKVIDYNISAGGSTDTPNVNNIYQQQAIVKVGSADISLSTKFGIGDPSYYQYAESSTGSIILSLGRDSGGAIVPLYSNFMVGDADKSGSNDLCYYDYTNDFIKCVDQTGITTINFNYNVTPFNHTYSLVMGDFCPTTTRLGFASINGIACYNTTIGRSYWLFKSDLSIASNSFDTNNDADTIDKTGSVIQLPTSLHTVYIYNGGANIYVFRNPLLLEQCGNGVCDNTENAYSCAQDCSPNASTVTGSECCSSDNDCFSPYTKCYVGSCVKGYQDVTCYGDNNCPIESPICLGLNNQASGKCVQSIAGGEVCNTTSVFTGSPTFNNLTQSTGNAQQDIYNTWQILFGASAWLRYFIGILILIGTLWGASQSMRIQSPTIIGIIGLVMMVFLTMIGLLPIWMVLIIAILLFFIFYTKIGSNTSGG